MEKQLRLLVGIENFEEIRTNNYYYVDKTKLIEWKNSSNNNNRKITYAV